MTPWAPWSMLTPSRESQRSRGFVTDSQSENSSVLVQGCKTWITSPLSPSPCRTSCSRFIHAAAAADTVLAFGGALNSLFQTCHHPQTLDRSRQTCQFYLIFKVQYDTSHPLTSESQWLGAPSCQRGSYAFYKSVSSRAEPNGPVKVWKLGEFYFIRCGPQDPVCIAEVTLLWEDQARHHLLASARLYFLPEDTPKGRTREHGEDEVLAVSRKMVVRVDDLVKWSCAGPAGWRSSQKPPPCGTNGLHKPPQGADVNSSSNTLDKSSEPTRHKTESKKPWKTLETSEPTLPPDWRVVHVVYFLKLFLRWLGGASGHQSAQLPTVLPLPLSAKTNPGRSEGTGAAGPPPAGPGSHSSAAQRQSHVLQGHVQPPDTGEQCQLLLAVHLRGRPRKRRGRDGKDSPNSSQSESWIDRMKVTSDRLWKVVYNKLGGCPGSTSAATCTRRHYERSSYNYPAKYTQTIQAEEKSLIVKSALFQLLKLLMLPYEEHLRAAGGGGGGGGGAEFKIPESPIAPKPRGIRGRKPLLRGRKPGPKAKEKKAVAPGPAPPPQAPKTKELKSDRGEVPSPGSILSTLPRHFVGGSLGGFSPIKGVCPTDVFRNISLQRGLESPALTPQDQTQQHPTIYTLQPKSVSPDTPHPSGEHHQPQSHPFHQNHNRCTGCNGDEGAQRGANRDARIRPPLPPLRVLPLNLDCSVQVCQLMRSRRLDSSQLQTFTRRLSEALSQDLSSKPPCSPVTPPPEQALPLNLSKRFMAKRPSTEGPEPSHTTINGNTDQPLSKKPRTSCTEQAEDFTVGGRTNSGACEGGQDVEMKNQEEPADLSSPSRIRAFLLGLPPFQVKLEEDLNGTRFMKFLPPGSEGETQRTVTEKGEGGVVAKKEVKTEEEEDVEDLFLLESGKSYPTWGFAFVLDAGCRLRYAEMLCPVFAHYFSISLERHLLIYDMFQIKCLTVESVHWSKQMKVVLAQGAFTSLACSLRQAFKGKVGLHESTGASRGFPPLSNIHEHKPQNVKPVALLTVVTSSNRIIINPGSSRFSCIFEKGRTVHTEPHHFLKRRRRFTLRESVSSGAAALLFIEKPKGTNIQRHNGAGNSPGRLMAPKKKRFPVTPGSCIYPHKQRRWPNDKEPQVPPDMHIHPYGPKTGQMRASYYGNQRLLPNGENLRNVNFSWKPEEKYPVFSQLLVQATYTQRTALRRVRGSIHNVCIPEKPEAHTSLVRRNTLEATAAPRSCRETEATGDAATRFSFRGQRGTRRSGQNEKLALSGRNRCKSGGSSGLDARRDRTMAVNLAKNRLALLTTYQDVIDDTTDTDCAESGGNVRTGQTPGSLEALFPLCSCSLSSVGTSSTRCQLEAISGFYAMRCSSVPCLVVINGLKPLTDELRCAKLNVEIWNRESPEPVSVWGHTSLTPRTQLLYPVVVLWFDFRLSGCGRRQEDVSRKAVELCSLIT
ncbi:AT-rich interactive domain-containing protein 5B [Channa argus]|uniref:AT-rich interactive domain-containing protein 5B n=1 Tax=Channa argus TaxID=215402 RepID=A0A6G1QS54_CHAAH|nr:AT-rich interactive domain-containing protein 5B [Channa argus]